MSASAKTPGGTVDPDDIRGDSLLSPYRVLDLTDQRGLLCGRILADLGADVIQVEPPGGSAARAIGPFYRDHVEYEKSLFWSPPMAGGSWGISSEPLIFSSSLSLPDI